AYLPILLVPMDVDPADSGLVLPRQGLHPLFHRKAVQRPDRVLRGRFVRVVRVGAVQAEDRGAWLVWVAADSDYPCPIEQVLMDGDVAFSDVVVVEVTLHAWRPITHTNPPTITSIPMRANAASKAGSKSITRYLDELVEEVARLLQILHPALVSPAGDVLDD